MLRCRLAKLFGNGSASVFFASTLLTMSVFVTSVFISSVFATSVFATPFLATVLVSSSIAMGQDDLAKERRLAERFQTLLEKTPRRGTALDRVYSYHAEMGTLDDLVGEYQKRIADQPDDDNAWFIIGLLESKRGNDPEAIAAFRNAEKTKNPLASYYLGQSLLLAGQNKEATAAIERGIASKPARPDLLEMYQSLGRIHQRAHRYEDALAVWGRLEKQFPGDQRVAEQIATALAEEDQFEEAWKRYENLAAKSGEDLYRRVVFQIEAANMTLQMGKKEDALKQFERLLGQLKPESWLHQQVRGKIEAVYRQADDLAGLATYYESWIKKHRDDLGAMSRLATTLSSLGRGAEARKWFDKAIELAPTQADLRQALIDQLVYDRKYADAIEQYAELDKVDPNNPDYIRQWGLLLLKDTSRAETERKSQATEVWMRLVTNRPNDVVTITQVADLLRQSDVFEKAEELYKRAVELKPGEPQYREYLGEFYHDRDRKDEALAAWNLIAEPPNRNAANLHRLAEVLSGFGYIKQAIESALAACELEDDSYQMQMTLVDLLADDGRFKEMLPHLDHMEMIATNLEEREGILDRRIRAYEGAEILDDQIEAMRRQLADNGAQATSEEWRTLARYLESKRLQADAIAAATKAVDLNDQSVPGFRLLARLYENTGDMAEAAKANRRLAVIDSQFKTTYLTDVARLEARLGRVDEALQAGRDLIAAAPGNPEHYHFFAELCFQLGKSDEGLATLRRAVRSNPADIEQLLKLGGALTSQFRIPEAIELYWRAFEKADDMNDKVTVISNLADLYLQQNQFDTLIARLERLRREKKEDRTFSFCAAAAYLRAQDYSAARAELMVHLAQNDRDTHLLEQIGQIAEQEGDIEAAVKYQHQLVQLAPNPGRKRRLSTLYFKSDQLDEAEQLMAEMALEQDKLDQIVKSVDELIAYDRLNAARQITTQLVRDNPRNWEALYRDAVVLAQLDKKEEAIKRFEQILALNVDDDEKSAEAKENEKRRNKRSGSGSSSSNYTAWQPIQRHGLSRVQSTYEIRRAVGLDNDRYYYNSSSNRQRRSWGPADYGNCRIATLGWLYRFASAESIADEKFTAKYPLPDAKDRSKVESEERRQLLDGLYLASVRNQFQEQYAFARRLSFDGSVDSQWIFLSSLGRRVADQNQQSNQKEDKTPPLPGDELDYVLSCFRNLQKNDPQRSSQLLAAVLVELKRAKREEQDQSLYQEAITAIDSVQSAIQMASLAANREELDQFLQLVDRAEELLLSERKQNQSPSASLWTAVTTLMWRRANEDDYESVFKLMDRFDQLITTERLLNEQLQTGRRKRPNFTSTQSSYAQILNPAGQTYFQSGFPEPCERLNHASFSVLRNAFEIYTKNDVLSDLLKHLRDRANNPPKENEKILRQLALAYVLWWQEEFDESVELIAASTEALGDPKMKFMLANAYNAVEDSERALEVLDGINALDQATIQAREKQVLNLAVQMGFVERAREAAERLFGVRLNANEQVNLAKQMHQLGQHELAEAVLRRARRRSGADRNNLLSVMVSYQQQGKMDTAVQIANQILQRPAQPNSNGRDNVREQAVRILAQSGKLKEIIARAETQLEQSPKSQRLMRNLAQFYKAAKDNEKAKAMYTRMADEAPDSPKARFELAELLREAGQKTEALDQYVVALKKDIRLYNNNYWQIQRLFEEKKRTNELLEIFAEADLRKAGDPYRAINLLSNLRNNSGSSDKDLQMKIVDKLWEAFPNYRSSLMSNLSSRKNLMAKEKLYRYASTAFLESNINYSYVGSGWQAMSSIHSWSRDSVESAAGMLLEFTDAQNKYDDLTQRLNERLEKDSSWISGKVMLSLMKLKQGNIKEASAELEPLLFDEDQPISGYAAMVVGGELRKHKELNPLRLRLFEKCINDEQIKNSGLGFEYGIGGRLLELYKDAGRTDDAIRMILAESRREITDQYDPQYAAYQWVERQSELSQQLLDLKQPLEALKILREVESQPQKLELTNQWGGSYYIDRFNEALSKAKTQVSPVMFIEDLTKEAFEAPEPKSDPKDDEKKPQSQVANANANDKKKKTDDRPAIDFMLYVEANGDHKGTLRSPLLDALAEVDQEAPMLAKAVARLDELKTKRPDDLSVKIAQLIVRLRVGDEKSTRNAIEDLNEWLARNPLDELNNERANSRQRRQAAKQIIVWLAAQACIDREDTKSLGHEFASRAVTAAERQTDKAQAAAMLQNLGSAMIGEGDRENAEAYWKRMLELLLDRKLNDATDETSDAGIKRFENVARFQFDEPAIFATVLGVARPPWSAPASQFAVEMLQSQVAFAVPAASSAPKKRSFKKGARPVTKTNFRKIAELARLASENNMHDLSLQCIGEALRTGPPIDAPIANEMSSSGFISSTVSTPQSSESSEVHQSIAQLEQNWRSSEVDSKLIYATLKQVVFPPSRKGEVFVYAENLQLPDRTSNDSVGRLLVQTALRSKQIDDLKNELTARAEMPLAQLPVKLIEAYVGIAADNNQLATETLSWFGERLKQDSQVHTIQMACYAGLPALKKRDLMAAALTMLDQAAQAASNDAQNDIGHNLNLVLARHEREMGDTESAANRLKELGKKAIESLGTNSSTTALRRKLIQIGAEQGEFGNLDETLDFLGRIEDLPDTNATQSDTAPLVVRSLRVLETMSPSERYEKLLAWMMPTETRQSIRLGTSFIHQQLAPEEFYKNPDSRPTITLADSEFGSFVDMLINDAMKTGKIEELIASLKPHMEEKVDHAAEIFMVASLAAGQGKSITKRINDFAANTKARSLSRGGNRTIPFTDYLVARAILRSNEHEQLGKHLMYRLAEYSQHRNRDDMIRAASRALVDIPLQSRGLEDTRFQSPKFDHWQPAGFYNASISPGAMVPDCWLESDGMVSILTSSEHPFLFFRYPITGDFEFSVDVWDAGWGEGIFSYGGFQFDPKVSENRIQIESPGGIEEADVPWAPMLRGGFNRWTVKSENGTVRYSCNQRPVMEVSADQVNPFLALAGGGARKSHFYRPELKGTPKIPREVDLLQGDRLVGWIPTFFNEQRQKSWEGHPSPGAKSISDPLKTTQVTQAGHVTWSVHDGILTGQHEPTSADQQPSLLFYYRPLMDGESLAYEFLYRKDENIAHPCFDRTAYLLTPDGVKSHWRADGPIATYHDADQTTVAIADSKKIPLKEGEWNKVAVRQENDGFTIIVNDQPVLHRPHRKDANRLFGFFHFKDRTEAKLRNVTLQGNWPEQIDGKITDQLLARADNLPAEVQRIHTDAIGERAFSSQVESVLRHARSLEPAARFEFLKRWVLPNDSHDSIRLYGIFASESPTTDSLPIGASNELHSPAVELLKVAREIGRLEELTQTIEDLPRKNRYATRCVLAMKCLIAGMTDNQAASASTAKELESHVRKVPLEAPMHERFPELLVVQFVAEMGDGATPEFLAAAQVLADAIQRDTRSMERKRVAFFDQEQGDWAPHRDRQRWSMYARACSSRISKNSKRLENQQTIPTTWGQEWFGYAHGNCSTRGQGIEAGAWRIVNDTVFHDVNIPHDALYYQKPITGDFELTCELNGIGDDQLRLSYAGLSFNLSKNLQQVEVQHFDRAKTTQDLKDTKLTISDDEWFPAKLVVTGSKIQVHFKGEKIYDKKLPGAVQPWLYVYADANCNGGIRNCKVTGGESPTSFSISNPQDLRGWLFYYDDSVLRKTASWNVQERVMIGKAVEPVSSSSSSSNSLKKAPVGSNQENYLKYHRPLLEDCEVQFEFFYVRDKILVHPAIGRMALMLSPNGVGKHWITDAQWDRTGLAPGNFSAPAADASKLSLNENDWNTARLTIVGNHVSLTVNGDEVYHEEIGTEVTRELGFFHFADQTEARFKNVQYKSL